MKSPIRLTAAILGLAASPVSALSPPGEADKWAFDFETGAMWRVSGNTWIDYLVLPQVISLRSPEHLRFDLLGRDLTVRARASLLIEPIATGPESLYVGFSASPSIEWWLAPDQACWYASIGGGFGWIDSQGVDGGQGQDFTLNWFATTGLRWYLRPDFAVNAGIFFQHLSNGGATDPNPGLDSLGPMIGCTWSF
jgi:hypothetical protein